MSGTAINALAVDKRVARGSGHRVRVMRVGEIEVVDVRRVDDIHVVDSGVPDVDIRDEVPAATESGKEGFPESEREPADRWPHRNI